MRIGSTTPDLIRSAVLNNTTRPRAPVTFAPCVSSAASDMSGGKCPTAAAVNTPPLVCTGSRLQRSQGFAQGNDVKSDKLSACITAAAAAAAAASSRHSADALHLNFIMSYRGSDSGAKDCGDFNLSGSTCMPHGTPSTSTLRLTPEGDGCKASALRCSSSCCSN